MREIDIKEATQADAKTLAKAEHEIFTDAWSEKTFEETMKVAWTHIYIVYFQGQFAGYAVISLLAENCVNLDNIAVVEQFRRKGIAEFLLKYIINKYGDRECIWLEVRESNIAARSLYEKLGFYVNGKRPNYYTSPKENAILMQKDLT